MKPAEIDFEYKDLIEKIGARIRELRNKKGISYTKMAKEIGLSRNGYNNIELGKSNFQILTLLRILSYYDMSIFDFVDSLKH
jgi:transcriptional regulator with XRE-family HTH domain